jgi:hypothetical protein
MKRKILLIATLFSGSLATAQVTETVSMGVGYANENYYTLNNGNETSIARSDWDLGFASDGLGGFSSTIRINGANQTKLYLFSNDINQWNTLDTNGFAWDQIVNSEDSWLIGAFQNQPAVDGFDLGWGVYNQITHIVSGNKIFILKLSNGEYKKLIIDELTGGAFTFHYADLDGTNLVSATIDKANYSGKNFGYYSIQNNTAIDREPNSESWDLLFTKYVVNLGGGMYYGVTGVLGNLGVQVAQINNVNNIATEDWTNQTYSEDIGTIGYDWKAFNMTTFAYEIEDSLVYFIEDKEGDIYKVIFTDFGGSATGDFVFTKEMVSSVGINEQENQILNVYPNPASEFVYVTFSSFENKAELSIIDLSGKVAISKQLSPNIGLNQETIETSQLSSGIYLLLLKSSKGIQSQKIIIR